LFGGAERPGLEQVCPTRNRVQRRSQLVTECRQELVLDAICLFGLNSQRALIRELAGKVPRVPVAAHAADFNRLSGRYRTKAASAAARGGFFQSLERKSSRS